MKNYFFITIAAVLMLFSCDKEKNGHKDTEIYLKVIKNIKDCQDIKDCIQFSDNRGDSVSVPGKPEVFTSKVNPDKWVKWMSAKDSDPKIEILEVYFKEVDGNVDILKEKKMKAKEKDSIVIGKVKPKKDSIKNLSIEYYTIVFSIDGIKDTIDPKLEFHR